MTEIMYLSRNYFFAINNNDAFLWLKLKNTPFNIPKSLYNSLALQHSPKKDLLRYFKLKA